MPIGPPIGTGAGGIRRVSKLPTAKKGAVVYLKADYRSGGPYAASDFDLTIVPGAVPGATSIGYRRGVTGSLSAPGLESILTGLRVEIGLSSTAYEALGSPSQLIVTLSGTDYTVRNPNLHGGIYYLSTDGSIQDAHRFAVGTSATFRVTTTDKQTGITPEGVKSIGDPDNPRVGDLIEEDFYHVDPETCEWVRGLGGEYKHSVVLHQGDDLERGMEIALNEYGGADWGFVAIERVVDEILPLVTLAGATTGHSLKLRLSPTFILPSTGDDYTLRILRGQETVAGTAGTAATMELYTNAAKTKGVRVTADAVGAGANTAQLHVQTLDRDAIGSATGGVEVSYLAGTPETLSYIGVGNDATAAGLLAAFSGRNMRRETPPYTEYAVTAAYFGGEDGSTAIGSLTINELTGVSDASDHLDGVGNYTHFMSGGADAVAPTQRDPLTFTYDDTNDRFVLTINPDDTISEIANVIRAASYPVQLSRANRRNLYTEDDAGTTAEWRTAVSSTDGATNHSLVEVAGDGSSTLGSALLGAAIGDHVDSAWSAGTDATPLTFQLLTAGKTISLAYHPAVDSFSHIRTLINDGTVAVATMIYDTTTGATPEAAGFTRAFVPGHIHPGGGTTTSGPLRALPYLNFIMADAGTGLVVGEDPGSSAEAIRWTKTGARASSANADDYLTLDDAGDTEITVVTAGPYELSVTVRGETEGATGSGSDRNKLLVHVGVNDSDGNLRFSEIMEARYFRESTGNAAEAVSFLKKLAPLAAGDTIHVTLAHPRSNDSSMTLGGAIGMLSYMGGVKGDRGNDAERTRPRWHRVASEAELDAIDTNDTDLHFAEITAIFELADDSATYHDDDVLVYASGEWRLTERAFSRFKVQKSVEVVDAGAAGQVPTSGTSPNQTAPSDRVAFLRITADFSITLIGVTTNFKTGEVWVNDNEGNTAPRWVRLFSPYTLTDDAVLDLAKASREAGDRGKLLGTSATDQDELALHDPYELDDEKMLDEVQGSRSASDRGKLVAVKSDDEDALELVDAPSGGGDGSSYTLTDDAVLDLAKETRAAGDRNKVLGTSETDENDIVLHDRYELDAEKILDEVQASRSTSDQGKFLAVKSDDEDDLELVDAPSGSGGSPYTLTEDAVLDLAKETRTEADRGKALGTSATDENDIVLLDPGQRWERVAVDTSATSFHFASPGKGGAADPLPATTSGRYEYSYFDAHGKLFAISAPSGGIVVTLAELRQINNPDHPTGNPNPANGAWVASNNRRGEVTGSTFIIVNTGTGTISFTAGGIATVYPDLAQVLPGYGALVTLNPVLSGSDGNFELFVASFNPHPDLLPIEDSTSTRTLTASDLGRTLRLTGSTGRTWILPDITGAVKIGSRVHVLNDATENLTIDGFGADTINGQNTHIVVPGRRVTFQAVTSSTWTIVADSPPPQITSTEKTAGTETAIRDFTPNDIRQMIGIHTRLGVVNKTADTTIVTGDRSHVLRFVFATGMSTALTATLPDADGTGIGSGWDVWILNDTSEDLTVTAHAGDDINGSSSITVTTGHAVHLVVTGATDWDLVANTLVGGSSQLEAGNTLADLPPILYLEHFPTSVRERDDLARKFTLFFGQNGSMDGDVDRYAIELGSRSKPTVMWDPDTGPRQVEVTFSATDVAGANISNSATRALLRVRFYQGATERGFYTTFIPISENFPPSDAEIKASYERNDDTNAFTDAEQTRLAALNTDAKLKDRYESNDDTNAFRDADETKLDALGFGRPDVQIVPIGFEDVDAMGDVDINAIVERVEPEQDINWVEFWIGGIRLINQAHDPSETQVLRGRLSEGNINSIKATHGNNPMGSQLPCTVYLRQGGSSSGQLVYQIRRRVVFGAFYAVPDIPTVAPPEAETYYTTQIGTTAAAPAFATPVWNAGTSMYTGITTGWSTTRPTSIPTGHAVWIAQVWRHANGTVLHIVTREVEGYGIRFFTTYASTTASATYTAGTHYWYELRVRDGWGPRLPVSPAIDRPWAVLYEAPSYYTTDGAFSLAPPRRYSDYSEILAQVDIYEPDSSTALRKSYVTNALPVIPSTFDGRAAHDATSGTIGHQIRITVGGPSKSNLLCFTNSLDVESDWDEDGIDITGVLRKVSATDDRWGSVYWKARAGAATKSNNYVRIRLIGKYTNRTG